MPEAEPVTDPVCEMATWVGGGSVVVSERRAPLWVGGGATTSLGGMRLLRRVLLALSTAGAIAGILRVRGSGGVPPQSGGWRELEVD